MTKMIRFTAVALMAVMTATLAAQQTPTGPRPSSGDDVLSQDLKGRLIQIPLKLQLVLSRYKADKKLSSVPYLLWLTAAERTERTNLRMGVKIPVASTMVSATGATTPSYSYQDVGTNIDCYASPAADGFFKVNVTVSDTSVYFQEKDDPQNRVGAINPAVPSFRSFTSNFIILLRDNQTAQYTVATDQVSGEQLKIDATLNVLK